MPGGVQEITSRYVSLFTPQKKQFFYEGRLRDSENIEQAINQAPNRPYLPEDLSYAIQIGCSYEDIMKLISSLPQDINPNTGTFFYQGSALHPACIRFIGEREAERKNEAALLIRKLIGSLNVDVRKLDRFGRHAISYLTFDQAKEIFESVIDNDQEQIMLCQEYGTSRQYGGQ